MTTIRVLKSLRPFLADRDILESDLTTIQAFKTFSESEHPVYGEYTHPQPMTVSALIPYTEVDMERAVIKLSHMVFNPIAMTLALNVTFTGTIISQEEAQKNIDSGKLPVLGLRLELDRTHAVGSGKTCVQLVRVITLDLIGWKPPSLPLIVPLFT